MTDPIGTIAMYKTFQEHIAEAEAENASRAVGVEKRIVPWIVAGMVAAIIAVLLF